MNLMKAYAMIGDYADTGEYEDFEKLVEAAQLFWDAGFAASAPGRMARAAHDLLFSED
jgi:hypothetical protein